MALKNQQQAEREEQQRIKNLVLNLDLRENEDQDGDLTLAPLQPNANIYNMSHPGHDKLSSYHHNRPEKSGKERGQRVRKLQLSDVDWYERSHSSSKKMNPEEALLRDKQLPEATAAWDHEAEDKRTGHGAASRRRTPASRPKASAPTQNARSRRG